MNGNIAAAYFEPAAIKASEAILVVPAPRVCRTDPAKSSSMRAISLENLNRWSGWNIITFTGHGTYLFNVIPGSVLVKNLYGALMTALSNNSCSLPELLGTVQTRNAQISTPSAASAIHASMI